MMHEGGTRDEAKSSYNTQVPTRCELAPFAPNSDSMYWSASVGDARRMR
jgi:hypothetical protein